MEFHIGAIGYLVRRQWDLRCDGERLDGFVSTSRHEIILDGDLDEAALVSTLRHEHAHAWEFEVGIPRTEEDRANFTATVGAAFDKEFNEQGGITALTDLPIEGNRPTRTKPPMGFSAISDRVQCGHCGTSIMSGSISTSSPEVLDAASIIVVYRGFQCPVCDSVQIWMERASESGLPLGEFYGAKLLTGDEAEKWLSEHRVHSPYNVG